MFFERESSPFSVVHHHTSLIGISGKNVMGVVKISIFEFRSTLDIFLGVASHDWKIQCPSTDVDHWHVDQFPLHKEAWECCAFAKDDHHHHDIDPTLMVG